MRPIKEQLILITGATDGIGKITAQKLASMGASVLIHGRSHEKCESTLNDIREKTGNKKLGSYVADFSSLSEVRTMAEQISTVHSKLHVLINNAGVGPPKPAGKNPLSKDGYEICFAVNYLAPFLLTHLLVPLLKRGAPSRIVNISSAAQEPIDFDMMLERSYNPWKTYGQSKLALTIFTFDLAEQLKDNGVTVNCLHPGSLLDTKMVRESFGMAQGSAESGAEVEVYAATDPALEGRTGRYFDQKQEARAHRQAYEPEVRRTLRELSEELTGIQQVQLEPRNL
ncbi:MAG: SDR family NAD(P)-dependent oxidoreductase [Desulfobacteraceae bacterium]